MFWICTRQGKYWIYTSKAASDATQARASFLQASQEDGGVPQRGIHTVTAASQGPEVKLLLYFGILMIVFNIAKKSVNDL